MTSVILAILALYTFSHTTTASLSDELTAIDKIIIQNCTKFSSQSLCTKKIQEIRDGKIKLASKAESGINIVIIKKPQTMIAKYFCLATYKNIIPNQDFTPDLFAYAVQGFAFNNNEFSTYLTWLKSPKSAPCKKQLKTYGLSASTDLPSQGYSIILNPITFLEDGAEGGFDLKIEQIYHHELLHIVYDQKKLKGFSKKLWTTLTPGEKQQFKNEHPSYNFKNQSTLYKEFFSYTFQHLPEEYKKYAYKKDFKDIYKKIKSSSCSWCVGTSNKINRELIKISRFKPRKLLDHVKKEADVLILKSSRKNNSKMFTWGQVMIDKGSLQDISGTKNLLGKALCKGEVSQAKHRPLVLLASDAPYSTLLHEYLHIKQIKKDKRWCFISKKMWGSKNINAQSERMVRDREWDVRLALWQVKDSPHFNIEDKVLLAEGLLREYQLRKKFDPSSEFFINKNKIIQYFDKQVAKFKQTN